MRHAFPISSDSRWFRLVLTLLAALVVCSGGIPITRADSLTVTQTTDSADGICNADCSLREAITAANATSGADIITLPAGTYTLTLGDLNITDDVTINGAGAAVTIIDGNAAARIFDIDPLSSDSSRVSVTITGVLIQNGRETAEIGPTGAGLGGGIRNFGTLELTNSLVRGNTATGGGGIANMGVLKLVESSISGNSAAGGGGIANIGTAEVIASIISENSSTGNGGLFEDGGGIANAGELTLVGSTIYANIASDDGGGIRNVQVNQPPLFVSTGVLTSENSTISGNEAGQYGGGIANKAPATAALNNVTIANNTADADENSTGDGGGIFDEENSSITLSNTLIADNSDAGNEAPDYGGILSSQGHNFIEDTTGCTISGDTMGNLTGDPDLVPLQDNGGPTLTHALLERSPAIDAGNATTCTAMDQRGIPRPSGERCDIGAYEVEQAAPVIPTITSLDPTAVEAGSAGFTLTLNGVNFVTGATVQWNGSTLPTTFVSAAQLTAQVSPAEVATTGTVQVTVVNPAPGGGTSNGVTFSITEPAPVPDEMWELFLPLLQ